MNRQLVLMGFAALHFLASLVALVVLVALGDLSWTVGGPLITALIGSSMGAGLALISPNASLPSEGGSDQLQTAGSANPLPTPTAPNPIVLSNEQVSVIRQGQLPPGVVVNG